MKPPVLRAQDARALRRLGEKPARIFFEPKHDDPTPPSEKLKVEPGSCNSDVGTGVAADAMASHVAPTTISTPSFRSSSFAFRTLLVATYACFFRAGQGIAAYLTLLVATIPSDVLEDGLSPGRSQARHRGRSRPTPAAPCSRSARGGFTNRCRSSPVGGGEARAVKSPGRGRQIR